MAMKDFNFKQFMLQKGEWVGLGAALVITLPVFGIGMMKILGSPRPTSTAMALEFKVKDADTRIQNAPVPADADKKPKEFFTQIVYGRVDPDEYITPTPWFIGSTLEDTKRRSPEVLPPGDFQVDVVRGGMKRHIISGKRVLVITEKSLVIAREKRTKRLLRITQDKLNNASKYGGPGGLGGPGYGSPGGERGGPMGPGGMSAAGSSGSGIPGTYLEDIDKVGTKQNVRLAEEIRPLRMAVVTGTFPFKQQMGEFRRALKKRTLDELFAMITNDEASWQFMTFKIQRRVFYPDGREKVAWQDYDEKMNADFATLFAEAVDYEKEDPELYKYEGLLNAGLVMVRPQLERGQYPKLEIQSIKDAIAKLDKEALGEEVKRPLSDLARKLQQKGLNPWDIFNPLLTEEEEEAKKAMQEKPPQPPAEVEKKKDTEAESELLIPDKALVRFVDVTVEPGLVYEYRLKVKMANPNYKKQNLAYTNLGKEKHIEASEWTLIPKVEVPLDIYYYATDEKPQRDSTVVQVHRWVDYLFKDPQNAQTKTPVGDWTIAEKLSVHRGEYVGRVTEIKVPLWGIEKEDWELGVNPKNKLDKKLPVDFTVRTSKALDPALLIDYQGGPGIRDQVEYRSPDSNKPKATTATDSVPVQLLILSPEGRLAVHNQQDDSSNEERVARHKAWKDWIAEVESGRRKPKPEESPLDKFRGGGSSN